MVPSPEGVVDSETGEPSLVVDAEDWVTEELPWKGVVDSGTDEPTLLDAEDLGTEQAP